MLMFPDIFDQGTRHSNTKILTLGGDHFIVTMVTTLIVFFSNQKTNNLCVDYILLKVL